MLKVDRSFVAGLGARRRGRRRSCAAVIDLAHALGLRAVAEGVERPDQLAVLRALGCDVGQGYYFARPEPPAAAEALARSTPRY